MNLLRPRLLFAMPLLLCATAMFSGCASSPLKTHIRSDPSANFQGYRTYGFAPQLGTNLEGKTTAMTVYFMQAVRHEMDSRGYQYTEDSPDLWLNFNANPQAIGEQKTRVTPAYGYSTGYYAYRASLYGLPVIGFEDEERVNYRVGTGNVDIVDARRKTLIWEGIAEGALTEAMLHDPGTMISAAVSDMFAQYPGKAAP